MINTPAMALYGPVIVWRCFAGSSFKMAGMRCGSVIVVIRMPTCTTEATATGATKIERFSHNSRRTDQYIGRVGEMGAAATLCEPAGSSGRPFDGGFIEPLL